MVRDARDPVDELAQAIRALTGRPASGEERRRFARYLDLLIEWNRTHRLTALRSRREVARGLFQDSLLFLPLLPARPLALVDIGAGAGIPGVPLGIVDPGISVTLVESRRKRVSFLSALRRDLGMAGMEILEGRAEDLIIELPELVDKFDVAVSRAAGSMARLVPTAMRFLRPGGVFIASGPPAEGQMPAIPPPVKGKWQKVPYPALGLTRSFLVARKEA